MYGAFDVQISLPKMNMSDIMKSASANSGAIDLSEVQDFSMSSKKGSSINSAGSMMQMANSSIHAALTSGSLSAMGGGKMGKLDDTLNKLMKRNNCVSNNVTFSHLLRLYN